MTTKELWEKAAELLGGEEVTRRFRVWICGVIKTEQLKRSESDSDAFFIQQASLILADLNKRTSSRFTLTPEASKMIKVIMSRGYLVEDFFRVNEAKTRQWLGNEKMERNLRPSTLYRACHFDEYLSEWFQQERQASELKAKRAAVSPSKPKAEDPKERTQLIAKLMARTWDSFDTWAELIRWTIQFPDAESLENYPMPERIRRMRTAPGMYMQVLKNASPQWAEHEYQEIKKGRTA